MGDAADAYFIIAAGVAIVQIRPPPPPPQSQSQSSTGESNHGSSVPESESASASSAAAPVVSSRKANDRRFFASIVSPSIAALALPPSAKPNAFAALAPIDGMAPGAEISGGAAQKSAARKSVDRAGSSLRGSDSILAQSLAFGETAAADDEDDDDIGESTDHFAQIDNHTTLSSSSVSSALAAATRQTAQKPAKPTTAKIVRPSRRESLQSPANPEAAFQVR